MTGRRLLVAAILAAVSLAAPAAGAPPAEAEGASRLAEPDQRTLLPLPFEVRDKLLRTMRQDNLGGLGDMLSALAEDDLEEADAFARMAARFHGELMPAVRRAAEMGDRTRVLKRLSEAVTGCNNCHNAFRLVEWPPDRQYDMPEPGAPLEGAGGDPEE